MKTLIKKLAPIASLLLLPACLNLQQAEAPAVRALAPTTWSATEIQALSAFSSVSASEQLNALVNEALQNNFDLLAAYERLAAVRQQSKSIRGGRVPSLDISLSDQNQKAFGLQTETARAVASVSWELDIWGRVASLSEQAQATALQQEALYRSAQYSIAAQLVQLWFDTIEAKQQLHLAQARLSSLRNSLEIIEDGFNSGIRQALDVYSARAELAKNQVILAQSERRLNVFVRQLAVLLGRAPSLDIDIPNVLPEFIALIPVELSSVLIARRPDLQAASYALQAQHNAVNVALANRLPRFSFSGSSGALNTSLSDVLSGNDTTWSLLGGVTAPIFRGGLLAAEQRRQQHLLNASIASYKQTALEAFQEVEQTINNEQQLQRELMAANNAARISDLAQEQALEQYISGISNINTWLQSQRNAFDRHSALLQTQALQLKNRVALYLALGGDFNAVENP